MTSKDRNCTSCCAFPIKWLKFRMLETEWSKIAHPCSSDSWNCLDQCSDLQRNKIANSCSKNCLGEKSCEALCDMLKALKNLVILDLRYARRGPSNSSGLIPLFPCPALRTGKKTPFFWRACVTDQGSFYSAGTIGSGLRSGASWLRRWKRAASWQKSKTFLGLRISWILGLMMFWRRRTSSIRIKRLICRRTRKWIQINRLICRRWSICEDSWFIMDSRAWIRLPSRCLWSFCNAQVPRVSPSWT